MKSQTVDMNSWGKAKDYVVCVHEVKDSATYNNGQLRSQDVRSFRILVAYKNQGRKPLPFRRSQWKLFDMEGFNYAIEMRNLFYADDLIRKLSGGVIDPGQQVKGWVAFQLPPDAEPEYVQFRANGFSQHVVNIRLGAPANVAE